MLGYIYFHLSRFPGLQKWAHRLLKCLIPPTLRTGPAVLHLNPCDPIISGALLLGVYERDARALFARSCKPGMVVVDVGAHIGLYTALAMHQSAGSVVAFEPFAGNLPYLRRTIAANASTKTDVRIVEAAASDREENARLFINPLNGGDNRLYPFDAARNADALPITTCRIDQALEDMGISGINYLKLDVQGTEPKVLRGAQATLARSPKVIILTEFWPYGLEAGGERPMDYLALLSSFGFALYFLRNDRLIPLESEAERQAFIDSFTHKRYGTVVALKGIGAGSI